MPIVDFLNVSLLDICCRTPLDIYGLMKRSLFVVDMVNFLTTGRWC